MPAREATALTATVTQETLPPNDPSHGTPAAMRRRVIAFTVDGATARWEQTDYGHPGRWNAPDPRGIAGKLQPKTEALRTAAAALGACLD
ncbi:MAG: hypothetical protein FJ029_00055 [Actinobacteria bacterium]|nr:hypothetical protein [Actinomycetota bacterium]